MKNRIEQEINKTLQYLDDDINIQASSLFSENINNRISNINISRGIGYRNNIYFSLVIILLVILNLTTLFMNFKERTQVDNTNKNQASVLANEYGIGQSGFSNI